MFVLTLSAVIWNSSPIFTKSERVLLERFSRILEGRWGVGSDPEFTCDANSQTFHLSPQRREFVVRFQIPIDTSDDVSNEFRYRLLSVDRGSLTLDGPLATDEELFPKGGFASAGLWGLVITQNVIYWSRNVSGEELISKGISRCP